MESDSVGKPLSALQGRSPEEFSHGGLVIHPPIRRVALALLLASQVQATGVFISEYCEGSSYNKALEIYNGGSTTVDLANYRFGLAPNGGATATLTTLSGTVAPGDVFVVCHASASATLLAVADATSSGFANWNGDDFVGLYEMVGGSPVLVDAIGVLGTDPGTGWAVAGTVDGTTNHTLARKSSIVDGTTNWPLSAGTSSADSQWDVLAIDVFTGFGSHNAADPGLPVLSGLMHSPATPAAAQAASVSVSVTDNGSVSSVLLGYRVNGGAWQNLAMNAGTPPLWQVSIPGQAASAQVTYLVTATDNLGNSATSASNSFTVAAANTGPVVANTAHAPLVPTSSQTVTVSADISDNGSVASARILYSVNNGATLLATMSAGTPPAWSGILPAQVNGATVSYLVEATDDEGLSVSGAPGTYTVSNQPAPTPVTAPVFTEASLSLGTVLTTGTGTATAHLVNTGSVPVVVERILALGGPFTASPASATLAAGQSLAITVSIQPPHNLAYSGWLSASGDWGATAIPLSASGDYPGTTWDATYNQSGTALKNTLASLVSGQTVISYDAARLEMFSDLDNVNGWVECVYTGLDVQTTGIPDNTVMNTEHTWPQSYGAEGDARSDLHHLFPTDSGVNSSRGNLPFGEVVVSSSGYPIGGSDRGTNAAGVTVFEPRDLHKGDCARAVMYFALRYGNLFGFLDMAGQESVLRNWHLFDPVSTKESTRNNDIALVQVKRNPFIDQPGLLLRLASLSGSADFPATAAAVTCLPDTFEVATAGAPLIARLWLTNTGGSSMSISSISTNEASCLSVGTWPASLAPGASASVPITIGGPCDGVATVTVSSSAGTRAVPFYWSWSAAAPFAPVVAISPVSGGRLLSWTAVSGATSCRVESALSPQGRWSTQTTRGATTLLVPESSASLGLFRVVALP